MNISVIVQSQKNGKKSSDPIDLLSAEHLMFIRCKTQAKLTLHHLSPVSSAVFNTMSL